MSLVVLAAIILGLAWLCWIEGIPAVYAWSLAGSPWRWLLGGFGILYLAIIPLGATSFAGSVIQFWDDFGAVQQDITSARNAQRRIEDALLADDPQQLVLILSYSREMLSEYYATAMSQARRSFRYCLI